MHGCGSGRRDSSLRMFVSSWRRISRDSAASLSVPRFDEARHWFYTSVLVTSDDLNAGRLFVWAPHQQVCVLLFETVKALRRVLGLVLVRRPRGEGVLQEARPLDGTDEQRGSFCAERPHQKLTKSMTILVSYLEAVLEVAACADAAASGSRGGR